MPHNDTHTPADDQPNDTSPPTLDAQHHNDVYDSQGQHGQGQDQASAPAWLPERLERARRSAQQELLAELGAESLQAAQAQRATLATLQAEHAQLNNDHSALQTQLEAAHAERDAAYLEAAFRLEAARYGFHDPAEARALADFSAVVVTPDGEVEGLREALHALAETRPHLLKRRVSPLSDAQTHAPGGFAPNSVGDLPNARLDDLKRRFKLG